MRTSFRLAGIGALIGLGLAGCVAYPTGPDTYAYAPAPYYGPYYTGSLYYYDGPRYHGPRRYYGPRYYGGAPRYYGGGPRHYGAPPRHYGGSHYYPHGHR